MTRQLRGMMWAVLAGVCVLTQSAMADDKAAAPKADKDGWITLFDGKSFDGWKINESKDSWAIEEGCIVAKGPRSHLFYTGRDFKDFEFQADVMTEPGSNSGIFFHTKFQEEGWPAQGYESQVNVTHGDPVKTGSLYNTVKLMKTPAKDNEWWTQTIVVKGKHVTVKVNDETVLEYDEPADKAGPLKLSEGTFALQAHDPKSIVRFKNLKVKPLE